MRQTENIRLDEKIPSKLLDGISLCVRRIFEKFLIRLSHTRNPPYIGGFRL